MPDNIQFRALGDGSTEVVLTTSVRVPDGYQFTGEYRVPRDDEWFMTLGPVTRAQRASSGMEGKYLILRVSPPAWRCPALRPGTWVFQLSKSCMWFALPADCDMPRFCEDVKGGTGSGEALP